MTPPIRRTLFVLFFLSGFASLIYQVVWTRMAFASFGVVTPVLSVVLSVFMLGLALGSWAGGRIIDPLAKATGISAAFFYGTAELIIGLSAWGVPMLFALCERLLLPAGQTNSFNYLLDSALALAISLFPWCVCMGTTFPFMMAYVRERDPSNTGSFSFLYLANVLGAMAGCILSAVVLIELLGFHRTLWTAAAGNFVIALSSAYLGSTSRPASAERRQTSPAPRVPRSHTPDWLIETILFSTGFLSMAMEVVWSRAFTPVLKTQVYSFAMIVFSYLGATFLGSWVYRRHLLRGRVLSHAALFSNLAIAAFIPVIANDPRLVIAKYNDAAISPGGAAILLLSIVPLCALLGYLTPSLIDEFGQGQPRRAGSAYALNVMGCILGPLVACYLLLPNFSERATLLLLALPFIFFWLLTIRQLSLVGRLTSGVVVAATVFCALLVSQSFETMIAQVEPNTVIRRDYTASVVSFGAQRNKSLLVNGFGMTSLTPITKFMAHLPLALHQGPPKSVLVICFGMGTTYRSALTWGIDVTAVELVPSVPKAFAFYHPDAEKYLHDPHGQIIIDDGRRYLRRCDRKFDVIIVDPPPPVEAAGSSLLFSRQFYELAKQHLADHGILQMWYPGSWDITGQAVLRAIRQSFPYLRCFPSVEAWGAHMCGSMEPILVPDPQTLAARLPAAARRDLLEWSDTPDPAAYFARVVDVEYDIQKLLNPDLHVQVTDDQPFNEYYLLRDFAPGTVNPITAQFTSH